MRLEVKGRNVEVNDSIRRYAEEKLDRIERQLPDETQIEVELKLETNPSISADHIAEATVWTKGSTLRAREASNAFETSIDQLSDKLERQVKRYRDKRSRRGTGRRANENQTEVLGRAAGPDDREVEAVRAPAAHARRGCGGARADRARLLRLHECRDRPDQRRLPAPRRRVRSDRATGLDGLLSARPAAA
jgi:putative sigma-54 modulation protein